MNDAVREYRDLLHRVAAKLGELKEAILRDGLDMNEVEVTTDWCSLANALLDAVRDYSCVDANDNARNRLRLAARALDEHEQQAREVRAWAPPRQQEDVEKQLQGARRLAGGELDLAGFLSAVKDARRDRRSPSSSGADDDDYASLREIVTR